MTKVFATILALALAGCAAGNLSSGAPPPTPDQTYFLLDVRPNTARIGFANGTVRDGRFDQGAPLFGEFDSLPHDGFVFGPVHGGDTLAMVGVGLVVNMEFHTDVVFRACNDTPTLVFTAPAGKVVYLGTVRFEEGRYEGKDALVPTYGYDLGSARSFLANHDPALLDQLVSVKPQLLPTTNAC